MTRLSNIFVLIVMVVLFIVGLCSSLFAVLSFSFGSALLSLAVWFALALLYFLKRILEELTQLRKFQERQVKRRDETLVDDVGTHPLPARERVSA